MLMLLLIFPARTAWMISGASSVNRGICPNMFLCKIAMDIEAKHIQADKDGVRIAELTEHSYREKMWSHRPLTDFWRVGKGYASKLEAAGMYTMGDVARMSVKNEDLLSRMFGTNAELLIDHAWAPLLTSNLTIRRTVRSVLDRFFKIHTNAIKLGWSLWK